MPVETMLKRLFRRTVSNVYDLFVLRHALSQCWAWSVAKNATAPQILILEFQCVSTTHHRHHRPAAR